MASGTGASRVAAGASAGLLATWMVRHARSPAVQAWSPGSGERRKLGRLSVRVSGTGDHTLVLIHGLTASGDIFGAPYDQLAQDQHVVIPDVLGFGRSMGSMDEKAAAFALSADLQALDQMIEELGAPPPRTVLGHSLGALLALHWAAHRDDVERVVCVCAPLYDSAAEADQHISAMGWLERLFAQGSLAQAMCAWMCHHRQLAGLLTAALEPKWPVSIAHAGVQHTWPSYLGAMEIIRGGGWREPLDELAECGVAVKLLDGAEDPVPVPDRSARLAALYGNVTAAVHPTGDHELPVTFPDWTMETAGLDQPPAPGS